MAQKSHTWGMGRVIEKRHTYDPASNRDVEHDTREMYQLVLVNMKGARVRDNRLEIKSIRPRRPALPNRATVESVIGQLESGTVRWKKYDQACRQLGRSQVQQHMKQNRGRLPEFEK